MSSLSPLSTHQATCRAISTDENVTTHVSAWIVVSARRIAGGQRRELVGRALGTRCRVSAVQVGAPMNEDRTAKLYAGRMGIVAVLVNVLIDNRERAEGALRAGARGCQPDAPGGLVSRSCWRTC